MQFLYSVYTLPKLAKLKFTYYNPWQTYMYSVLPVHPSPAELSGEYTPAYMLH